MSKVRVNCFAVSTDGFGAGPGQSLEHPLGVGGEVLHEWAFATASFKQMFGEGGGSTGMDNDFIVRGFDNVGAWILGRNMFGPVRGPWPDENWRGWWGENPPYHVPVFVLTHHARAPLVMEGGTTFHFITGGIHEALEKAKVAAQGKDVRIGGGVSLIRQYLQAGNCIWRWRRFCWERVRRCGPASIWNHWVIGVPKHSSPTGLCICVCCVSIPVEHWQ